MKLKNTIIALLIANLAVTASYAETIILWESPENFSDMTYRDTNLEKDRIAVMKDLERYFIDVSEKVILPSNTLTVKITDVDLAGEFEPWRMRAYDVRIIRSVYPARLSFKYTLTAEDGSVIAEGVESLHDNTMLAPFYPGFEDYPYVKDLFKTWVRKLGREYVVV